MLTTSVAPETIAQVRCCSYMHSSAGNDVDSEGVRVDGGQFGSGDGSASTRDRAPQQHRKEDESIDGRTHCSCQSKWIHGFKVSRFEV
jgi:hypothetical protein